LVKICYTQNNKERGVPMDVLNAIEKRREITSFKNEPISTDLLQNLIRSAYLAPSGNNLPSREFILVEQRSTLDTLASTTPYMKWLLQAQAAIVILCDSGLSKYWLQDASIAGGYVWLSAVSLGLGAAWGAVYHSEDTEESLRRESFVRKELNIPEQFRIVAILGLGWPAQEPGPKEMYPVDRVLHHEKYQSKS
jgi:nitroreductase